LRIKATQSQRESSAAAIDGNRFSAPINTCEQLISVALRGLIHLKTTATIFCLRSLHQIRLAIEFGC
jgi:hypothetical protein